MQMSFKVIEHSTNQKLITCHWSTVTCAISLTVSEIQAGLMLETTFVPNPLVFELEFEGHAIGM